MNLDVSKVSDRFAMARIILEAANSHALAPSSSESFEERIRGFCRDTRIDPDEALTLRDMTLQELAQAELPLYGLNDFKELLRDMTRMLRQIQCAQWGFGEWPLEAEVESLIKSAEHMKERGQL